jgi:hypothetical protein
MIEIKPKIKLTQRYWIDCAMGRIFNDWRNGKKHKLIRKGIKEKQRHH